MPYPWWFVQSLQVRNVDSIPDSHARCRMISTSAGGGEGWAADQTEPFRTKEKRSGKLPSSFLRTANILRLTGAQAARTMGTNQVME